ncbi:Allergen V5/Tpx-1 family protein [Beauveria bassiana ARSEF 2860]|uniref:Allergen V5/Tpx-1 family protein n=1 Tax=Beauveria bassiana (strain ARSEF 2860) TaxID=655819 RepID=J4UMZ2_BEAB2|nr:Allergen V5/Tpx-1 family protein [Beauveria bassiana ARSEF 2860]EJP66337.1 Allergen V5/Tpx-1 family protein [Beauveria bassiana ARSEF 2860]
MPYKEANQVVDNLGSGMSSDDTKGPEDWRKEENLLYKLLIEYRKEVNVQYPKIAQDPEIARSPTLDKVARTHIDNPYFETGSTCNPHSWTATADKEAKWKSCCFNIGQANTWPCMWDKPREISGGQFQGNGYEVYHGGNPNVYTAPMTAEGCLNAFKNSTGHNPVLINNGTWSTMKWESVGCGMGKGQCAIWFSPEKDSAASPDSQTAQDGLETPVAQKEEDALETPVSQKQQDALETPVSQKQQDDLETPVAEKQQDDLETPVAEKQQDALETPDAQKEKVGLKAPDAQKEKVGSETPDAPKKEDGLKTPGAQKKKQACPNKKPKNPNPSSNPTPTPTPTSTPNADATPDNESGVAKIWTQCGGKNWTGPTVCAEGLVCKSFGVWYSQCKPAA